MSVLMGCTGLITPGTAAVSVPPGCTGVILPGMEDSSPVPGCTGLSATPGRTAISETTGCTGRTAVPLAMPPETDSRLSSLRDYSSGFFFSLLIMVFLSEWDMAQCRAPRTRKRSRTGRVKRTRYRQNKPDTRGLVNIRCYPAV